ncbi:hypothetical protein ECG_06424 [Echinococcus granulosus]|uniref:Diagnostic antigen gp50 n=1 Tax=Echinococcus granulosus TaxID=6210 RepID=A0A068WI94_ECHGR|nr:hypothetical protein ECG_06424 [Echinococcus granulosus]CDS19490.1 diagnostic antigen gp50 [Echinococcus granulosus]
MIALATVYLFFALIRAESNQWGSRVIGEKYGSSGPMVFRLNGVAEIEAYDHSGKKMGNVEVIDGRCSLAGRTIGSPCTNKDGDVSLTMNEVRAQWKLIVKGKTEPDQAYTVLFVPDFKFPIPKKGYTVPSISVPLTRFANGKDEIYIKFAVQGIDNTTQAKMEYEGWDACVWSGPYLVAEYYPYFCQPLDLDWDTDTMIFGGFFPRMYADYSVINFTAADTLTVTVDWGEAAEHVPVA